MVDHGIAGVVAAPGQLRLRKLTERERGSLEPVRLRQGAVMGLSRPIADSAGGIGQPLQALSTLAAMERKGTITAAQRRAGDEFHRVFRMALLDGLKAPDLSRIASRGSGVASAGAGNERARRRITEAMRLLGGEQSIAASCAWHVLGLEWSLREWAAKAAGGNVHRACGVLLSTLGLIDRDFGG